MVHRRKRNKRKEARKKAKGKFEKALDVGQAQMSAEAEATIEADTTEKEQEVVVVHEPVLKFTPFAWGKLVSLNNISTCEIGAYGISDPDDLLVVKDIYLPQQTVSGVEVKFDDEGIQDYYEEQVLIYGRHPREFARIWIHSHPWHGDTLNPSGTDEDTFRRCFGECDWAIMFIINNDERYYCRMSIRTGIHMNIMMKAKIDYTKSITEDDEENFKKIYDDRVNEQRIWHNTYRGNPYLGYGNIGNQGDVGHKAIDTKKAKVTVIGDTTKEEEKEEKKEAVKDKKADKSLANSEGIFGKTGGWFAFNKKKLERLKKRGLPNNINAANFANYCKFLGEKNPDALPSVELGYWLQEFRNDGCPRSQREWLKLNDKRTHGN